MIILIILMSNIIFGIEDPKTDFFASQKKSIQLSTGIEMKYIEEGNPDGDVLILLHGYTDTSRSFKNVVNEILLLNNNIRIIVPDLRGHGGSSMPSISGKNDFEMQYFAADILDLMYKKNISSAHFVGHSMGNIIAQEIAHSNPDKVQSLILLGAFVNGKKNKAIQEYLTAITEEWKQKLILKYGENWKRESYSLTPEILGDDVTTFLKNEWVIEDTAPKDLLLSIFKETSSLPLGTWFHTLDALKKIDNTEKLISIKSPVLVLWANGDLICPEPDQDEVKDALRQAGKKSKMPMLYKSYNSSKDNQQVGHNFHWALSKSVARDILLFIQQDKIL